MGAAVQVILFGLLMLGLFSIGDELNKEMNEVITLPLKALIVKGELGSGRNADNATKLIENVNRVWSVANISFYVKSSAIVEMGSDEITTALKGNGRIFAEAEGYDANAVNMFFIKNMSHNGISFPEYRTVVMPDKTTNLEYVAAAHELGHVLGLDHNPEEEYLMFAVCNGTAIALAEILDVRNNAKRLLVSFNSNTMVLPPASVEFSVIS
jgi:hypothetical protein